MELFYVIILCGIPVFLYGLIRFLFYNNAKVNYNLVIGYQRDSVMVYIRRRNIRFPIVFYEVNGCTYKKRGWGKYVYDKPWNVYYNPNNPEKCILEGDNGVSSMIIGIIFLLLIFLFI